MRHYRLSLVPIILFSLVACKRVQPAVLEMEVQSSGVTLYARITGETPHDRVLIGVHGGPGNSSDYMLGLEGLAQDGITVVLYDQRGAGRSTEPTNGYALDLYVEDLEAVRKAVEVEIVEILGHSWGGVVAQRYATVYPERVRSLILYGSGPPRYADVRAAQAKLGERIASLQERGLIPVVFPSTSEDLVQAILPAYFFDAEFVIPEELSGMSFNQVTSDRTFAELGEWDFSSELGQLEHPVLMLWGVGDPFGICMVEATVSALTRADVDFVLLDDCGHYWQECSEDFFSVLRDFLDLSRRP
jgi:pimeloyl-ACP methyl ester carboxylesterase